MITSLWWSQKIITVQFPRQAMANAASKCLFLTEGRETNFRTDSTQPSFVGEKQHEKAEDHSAVQAEIKKHIIFLAPPKMCYGRSSRWNSSEMQNNWLDKSPVCFISFNIFGPYWKVLNLAHQERAAKEKNTFMHKVTGHLFFYKEKPYISVTTSYWGLWHDWVEIPVKHRK